jgi:predicted nucleic acid-binding protein
MSTKKQIVLDANILVRAVLGRKVRGLLEEHIATTQFFTPDECYLDARKYLPPLFEKRNLPAQEALDVLEQLTCLIEVVDYDLYSFYEEQAKQRIAMRDINDWTIVALVLTLDCPIWTEDTGFFGAGVATWTSDRVHLLVIVN